MVKKEFVIDGVVYIRKDLIDVGGRVAKGERYWYVNDSGIVAFTNDMRGSADDFRFNKDNYYKTQELCTESLHVDDTDDDDDDDDDEYGRYGYCDCGAEAYDERGQCSTCM